MTTEAAQAQSTWAEHEHYKKPWYWYDWANSAFVTTVGTVLFAPYLTTVAKEAACPGLDDDAMQAKRRLRSAQPAAEAALAPAEVREQDQSTTPAAPA